MLELDEEYVCATFIQEIYSTRNVWETLMPPWCKIQKGCIYAMKFQICGSTN